MLPLVASFRSGACARHATQQTKLLLRHVTSSSKSCAGTGAGPWQYAAAACGAAALAGLVSVNLASVAHGDTSDGNEIPLEARKKQFQQWMAANGADWQAAEVRQCQDADTGLGLFATSALHLHMSHRWLGRRLGAIMLSGAKNQTVQVATVPLDLAITARAARRDPELGAYYSELLDLGLLDERTAVIVMLMIEKLRGPGSAYAPYIQLLPERVDTPLSFSQEQLSELSGTTLAAATAARAAVISRTWDKLQPVVNNMLKQVGVYTEATLDDFKWATSVFWSRGLGLPVTSQGPDGVLRIDTQEGLVPGLDFANHSQQARCWWEVVEQQQQETEEAGSNSSSNTSSPTKLAAVAAAAGTSHVIQLMTNRAYCPGTGDELTISYGDKGNEELLLLYGFALPDNPSETLMLLCPVPPAAEWDEVFAARMHLMQARDLKPQLFLSAAHLANHQSAAAAAAAAKTTTVSSNTSSSSVVPAAAREVIEIFVMQQKELAAALERVEQQQQQEADGLLYNGPVSAAAKVSLSTSSSSKRDSSSSDDDHQLEQLGLRMAVLTTFVRLLELKMVQMEGEDQGTGPLEDDIRRLQEADAIKAAHQRQHGGHSIAAAEMPAWLRSCLLYRIGQKQLVRGYLAAARRELQETLTELQDLMQSTGEDVD